MIDLRTILLRVALALPAGLAAPLAAQSGRGLMHGYVAFEDVSYNEVTSRALHAKIELRTATPQGGGAYTARTDNHGGYDIPAIGMGEYTLTITAPGYAPYRIRLYIPSDFECRLAVMLQKADVRGLRIPAPH